MRSAWATPLAAIAGLTLAACGGGGGSAITTTTPLPAPVAAAITGPVDRHAVAGTALMLGDTSWTLDQLAPPPTGEDGPGVVVAVLRVTTAGGPRTLSLSSLAGLDDAGARWAPVRLQAYIAIDSIDDAPLEAQHGAAGTAAFRLPPGRHLAAVLVSVAGTVGSLDAPA